MTSRPGCVHLTVEDGIGVITIDRPPVNAIDAVMRAGIVETVHAAEADVRVQAIVLTCAGRTFIAGADLGELETGILEPGYAATLGALENCRKPVVAALFGTALGAGIETAMACHYRVASADARLGMPEIHMAIVPGAGGTQRLPRLIGAKAAMDFLLEGVPVNAERALTLGLVDEVLPGDIRTEAVRFARRLVEGQAPPRRTADQKVGIAGFEEDKIEEALTRAAKALPGRTTHRDVVGLIRTAADTAIDEGLSKEKKVSDCSLKSDAARSLIRLFFAERETARIPDLSKTVKARPIRRAAVVGAGTMGAGIAMALADAGLPVTLIEASAENLARARKTIQASYEASVKRGRITAAQAEQRVAAIEAGTRLDRADSADLVIEAVFEDLQVKKDVLAQLDRLLPKEAIIASNTSSLSLTELAGATSRGSQVVGLHFFSPANVMKLLEIVRGEQTSPETLVTALELAKKLRKIGVVSVDGFGFIGNRMMLDGYWREAELMMLEGVSPDRIDQVAENFGFAMGPMRVNDMAGVDIGAKVRVELAKREQREPPYCVISDALAALGRTGQKSGRGVYRYELGDRSPHHDPEVDDIVKRLAVQYGIKRGEVSDAEIAERLVLPLVNIGAELLEKKIAYRAGDIDVVWTSGYGFPRWRGGPMTYADILGLREVVSRISGYHKSLGSYWQPANLLTSLAERGSSFQAWDREHAAPLS